MTPVKMSGVKIIPEDPARLRERLTALAEHSGVDAVRVQATLSKEHGIHIVVTHSGGEAAEERVARHIGAWVEALLAAGAKEKA